MTNGAFSQRITASFASSVFPYPLAPMYSLMAGILAIVFLFLFPMDISALDIQTTPFLPRDGQGYAGITQASGVVVFEENIGQLDQSVKYIARTKRYAAHLTSNAAILNLRKPGNAKSSHIVRLELLAASTPEEISGFNKQNGKRNYITGNKPNYWITNIPTFSSVLYRQVYPGIDMVYRIEKGQLVFDFVVWPGADPNRIGIIYKGIEDLYLASDHDLILAIADILLRSKKPVAYQLIGNTKQEVTCEYLILDDKTVRLDLGPYDHTKQLIIDPMLAYSTYFGDVGDEEWIRIAVDAKGNAYIGGKTTSSDPYNSDAFVAKLNPTGDIVYATYIGGTDVEGAWDIEVDDSGHVYITGNTMSLDFPTTPGAFATDCAMPSPQEPEAQACFASFILKLDTSGSELIYSTYLHGNNVAEPESRYVDAYGVAVDVEGCAYVTGSVVGTAFPVTDGVFQSSTQGGGGDAFVTKINPTGSSLVYSTYLGGDGDETGRDIDVDREGNAIITGNAGNTKGFPLQNAFQPVPCESYEFDPNAFVAKINSSGSSLIYATPLGGCGSDTGTAISVDALGNAYVTGQTQFTDFIQVSALQELNTGGMFLTKFDSAGIITFSSYVGPGWTASGVASGPEGIAYVIGTTWATDFPVTDNAFRRYNYGIGADATVSQIDTINSKLVYSSYLGGSYNDYGGDIAVDSVGMVYVTGHTTSDDFPTSNPAQPSHADGWGWFDAFISKLDLDAGIFNIRASVIAEQNGGIDSVPLGIQCSQHWQDHKCISNFDAGSVVTLIASPNAISTFEGWEGDCSGTRQCNLTMDSSKTATATFVKEGRSVLKIYLTGAGKGTIAIEPAGVYCDRLCESLYERSSCDANCYSFYDKGTSVQLTANPHPGFIFSGWDVGHCADDASCTISLDSSLYSISAKFSYNWSLADVITILIALSGSDIETLSDIPDVNIDTKIGLEEAIHALHAIAGMQYNHQ